MWMIVFIFVHYLITTNSYIRCNTVQYSIKSTDNTTHVNEIIVNATIVSETTTNETLVNSTLIHTTLVKSTLC